MENVSVLYLMLEHIKNELQQHRVNVLNFLGHCASNVIFLVRLMTLTSKPLEHIPQTKFELSIDQFERNEFKELLQTV